MRIIIGDPRFKLLPLDKKQAIFAEYTAERVHVEREEREAKLSKAKVRPATSSMCNVNQAPYVCVCVRARMCLTGGLLGDVEEHAGGRR